MSTRAADGSRRLVVEADGGSRGNPGPAGFGALVRDAETGEVLAEAAEAIERATNNVAEYRGLVAGLEAAAAVDPDCTVEVRMDSKLVVEQMSGRWQITHEDMRRLAARARSVLPPGRVRYTWIPRAENAHADRLANEAMDAAAAGRPWVRRSAPPSAGDPRGTTANPPSAGDARTGPADPTGPVVRQPAGPSTSRGSVRAPRGAAAGEPTTLVLVRHGRTHLTQQGRFSGRDGEDPPLSDLGRSEAGRAADVVAGLGRPGTLLPDVPRVSAVIASPMLRTRETASAAADRLGLDVTLDAAWIEAGFGAWEGLTYGEIAHRDPELLQRWQGSTRVAPEGGESLDEVVARVREARAKVVAAHPGRTVLVVTHATPVRVVVHEALDAGPAALWRLRVTPCALTVARYWDDGAVELVTANATGHLGG